ncbi:AIPR family protein [Paenibacillus typhae]|uniref:AIPR protein n=1 Tax=Paenibacillus typhae TaxID=1174501 RepID=A0A1G8ZWG5_9BACL|nr:AIPR family protein [Paenibacillus typhae]SDK19393.1 AIPR protein [Paenibacillus typhae]
MAKNILEFAQDFQQEIISLSEMEGEENFREDQFTRLFMDYLTDFEEIEDSDVFSYRGRGMQINGYSFSEELDQIVLFVANYSASCPPESVRKSDLDAAIKRCIGFFKRALGGLHTSLEEASPVFDLAMQLFETKEILTELKIVYMTDGLAKSEVANEVSVNGIPIKVHVWDIERLYRSWSSGQKREAIEIDFTEHGQAIPCLPMPVEENSDYMTYLAIFPGQVLVSIYGQYGPRLLERNVRSFLQARGNVNKGIRSTIRYEPHMFLAYNNGLSAVAENIELIALDNGTKAIKAVKDLQIVNGGQTTASIYHAYRKDKADMNNLFVQVKLTVILNSSKIDEIVPRISEYANNQNKIQTADFSANDPFHRKVEELSRTIWAPATSGVQRQTRWFYERARGQYMDEKGRASTPAQKKQFDLTHPKHQLFTKTDLAKYENTWNQLPHIVSRGAQKNFNEFTVINNEQKTSPLPDQNYFERLVAKAILFRRTEKLVQGQKYGGYRANIVTYTLAWLAHATQKKIDIHKIWKEQDISPTLEKAIIHVSGFAHRHIINAPGNGNVTEWCKKAECWKSFEKCEIELPDELFEELVEFEQDRENDDDSEQLRLIDKIKGINSQTWFDIAAWSKETNNLLPWQRSLAFSLGKIVRQGITPSIKQAIHAEKILSDLDEVGYFLDDQRVTS